MTLETPEIMTTMLATFAQLVTTDIYQAGRMNAILAVITAEAEKQIYDMATKEGRQGIISLANRISKAKVHLDKLGKELVADWKNKSKGVDADRKKARDTLDALRDKIREPVTEWENIEKNRIKKIECRIDAINEIIKKSDLNAEQAASEGTLGFGNILIEAKSQLDIVKKIIIDESFQEFSDKAKIAKENSITQLSARIASLEELEKEEEIRKIEKQRQQQEHEKQIAEDARQDEQRKIVVERERAQQEKIELQKSLERQKIESKNFLDAQLAAAEAKAQADAQRIKEDQARKELEKKEVARLREANVENQRKCNNEAFTSFVDGGLDAVTSKLAVELIVKKKISHVFINY